MEKVFGVSMETLMRMQNSFDIAQARKREGKITVDRYVRKAGACGNAIEPVLGPSI